MGKVRLARKSELELLGHIEIDSDLRYLGTSSSHLSAEEPVFTPAVLREHYWAHDRLLIAEDHNAIVGFIVWGFEGNDEFLGVDQVSVARAYGQQGIGASLMTEVLGIADHRDVPTVLNTERSIPWNAPWYRRLGFTEVDSLNWTDWMIRTKQEQESVGVSWADRVWMLRPVQALAQDAIRNELRL